MQARPGMGRTKVCARSALVVPLHLEPYQPVHTATFRFTRAPDKTLWMATGVGLYRVAGDRIETPAPGLDAHSFYASKDGDLWIGTNGSGLVHLQPRLIRVFTRADGLLSNIVMTVLPARDGRLWVGTNCGFAVSDGARFQALQREGWSGKLLRMGAGGGPRKQYLDRHLRRGVSFRYRDGVFTQYTMEQGLTSRVVLWDHGGARRLTVDCNYRRPEPHAG